MGSNTFDKCFDMAIAIILLGFSLWGLYDDTPFTRMCVCAFIGIMFGKSVGKQIGKELKGADDAITSSV